MILLINGVFFIPFENKNIRWQAIYEILLQFYLPLATLELNIIVQVITISITATSIILI